jgi:hypothetical protein
MKRRVFAVSVSISCLIAAPARAQDFDLDGVLDAADNCAFAWNPAQGNLDGDSEGDSCDNDPDGDGLESNPFDPSGDADNCPFVPNPGQAPSAIPGIGAACAPVSLPLELEGVSAGTPLLLSFDLDPLPQRAEVRFEIEPESVMASSDLQVFCRGAGEPVLTGDAFGFLIDYELKVDVTGRGVFDTGQGCRRPQSAGSETWVTPLFLPYVAEAFDNPGDPHELACFVLLRSYGPAPPGGTFDVRVSARSVPPQGQSFSFCSTGCDDGPIEGAQISPARDYDCFTPDTANFSFLDGGNPAIGQCSFAEPNPSGPFPEIQYAIAAPDQWDCCIWQYQSGGLLSERGFANFWTGAGPPGPRPDADLDGILQRCDNCAAVSNAAQRDADADGPGDSCDLCPFDADPANSDVIPAGDACQCSDVDDSAASDLVDVVHVARFLSPVPDSADFDPARCRVSAGLDPIFGDQCGAAGLAGLRLLLARGDAPVESCE